MSLENRPEKAAAYTTTGEIDLGFQAFYKAILQPKITPVVKKKKRGEILAVMAGVLTFLVALFVLYHFPQLFTPIGESKQAHNWFAIFLCAAVLALLIFLESRRRLIRHAAERARQELIKPIVNFVDNAISYDPEKSISRAAFEQSMLFDTVANGYGRFSGTGLFSGSRNQYAFSFSPIKASKAEPHGCHLQRTDIFGGLFFVLEKTGGCDGFILVIPQPSGLSVQTILPRLERVGYAHAEAVQGMAHADFSRLFLVFAEKADEAKRILTHELMQKLTEIRIRHGVLPHYSRAGDTAYLALATGRDYFDLPAQGHTLDITVCAEYYNDLCLSRDLATDPVLRQ